MSDLMLQYQGSGSIDIALAYEYLVKGFGQYEVEKNSMLDIMGYSHVIVKPSYYKLWQEKTNENVTTAAGMIDVGFYTNFVWIEKEIWYRYLAFCPTPKSEWNEQQINYDNWFHNEYLQSRKNINYNDLLKQFDIDKCNELFILQTFNEEGKPRNKFFEFKVTNTGWG